MLIKIVIIVVCVIIVIIIVAYLASRIYKLYNRRDRTQAIQLSELIDGKCFIARDQTKLSTLGKINTKNDEILLCVHDFFGDKYDFKRMIDDNSRVKNLSIISYNQRGYDHDFKFKNVGCYVNDLTDALLALHRMYKKATISLLLEGYACGLAKPVLFKLKKQVQLKHIYFVNPISNPHRIKYGFIAKLGICFGFVFGFHKRMNFSVDYRLLCDEESFANNLVERNSKRADRLLIQILQFNQLNRAFWSADFAKWQDRITVIQGLDDIFYNKKRLNKWSGNYKVLTIDKGKHFNLQINFSELR